MNKKNVKGEMQILQQFQQFQSLNPKRLVSAT